MVWSHSILESDYFLSFTLFTAIFNKIDPSCVNRPFCLVQWQIQGERWGSRPPIGSYFFQKVAFSV